MIFRSSRNTRTDAPTSTTQQAPARRRRGYRLGLGPDIAGAALRYDGKPFEDSSSSNLSPLEDEPEDSDRYQNPDESEESDKCRESEDSEHQQNSTSNGELEKEGESEGITIVVVYYLCSIFVCY